MTKTVGIVGARGYTGSELLRILHRHPEVEVVWAGSREKAGEPVDDYPGLTFSDTDPEFVAANPVDVVFLALPDGASASFLGVIPDETVVIDISADHRWDTDWAYGTGHEVHATMGTHLLTLTGRIPIPQGSSTPT